MFKFLLQWRENCLGAKSIFLKIQIFEGKFEDLDNFQSRPEFPRGKIRLNSKELWLLSCFSTHVASGKFKNSSKPCFFISHTGDVVYSFSSKHTHTCTHAWNAEINWIALVSSMRVEKKKISVECTILKSGVVPQSSFKENDNKAWMVSKWLLWLI